MRMLRLIEFFTLLSNLKSYANKRELYVHAVTVEVEGKTYAVTSVTLKWDGVLGDHISISTDPIAPHI